MLITEFCLTILAVVAPALIFLLSSIYDTLRKIHGDLQKLDVRRRELSELSNGYALGSYVAARSMPSAVMSTEPA